MILWMQPPHRGGGCIKHVVLTAKIIPKQWISVGSPLDRQGYDLLQTLGPERIE
jgi:hypothetical protein